MSNDDSKIGRRDFLRGASAVGAAIAASPLLAAKTSAPESSTDITDLSATELSQSIRQRVVSCVEVMRAYLDRIDRLNPVHNALVSLRDEEELLAEARQADGDLEKGPFRGLDWLLRSHGIRTAVMCGAATSGYVVECDRISRGGRS